MQRSLIKLSGVMGTFQSRLSRRIVFWIFISITVIEAILMVPSVERRKQEVLSQITEVSSGKIHWILATYPQATGPELLAHTRQLYGNPMLQMILGGAVYGPTGKLIGSFGELPTLPFAAAQQGSQLYRQTQAGDRYDVAWTTSQSGGPYTIILRHNASVMRSELFAYVLRITGLVLIIAAFVTLVMMMMLGPLVVNPILMLRRDLAKAGDAVRNDQLAPQFDSTAHQRRDEMGEVITTFQHMFDQICQAIQERKQAEQALRQNNTQMQQYIQQVDRVTAAAAAVEKSTFEADSLAEVVGREDELGQLARVFQRMAMEVKQREDQLKQQVAELKIEIDQQKRQHEVAAITQSHYFQELQEAVDTLNPDEFWR